MNSTKIVNIEKSLNIKNHFIIEMWYSKDILNRL